MVKLFVQMSQRWVDKIMTVVMGLAFAAAMVVVLMTLVDVALRNIDRLLALFTGAKAGWAIVGLVDISQLFIMFAAALAIAVAFYRGAHVSVDLLTSRFSACGFFMAQCFAALLNFCFVAGCLWAGRQALLMDLEAATTSSTIAIPYLAFWLPLLGGFVLSGIGIVSRFIVAVISDSASEQSGQEVVDYV